VVAVPNIHINFAGLRLDRDGTGPLGLRLGLDLQGGTHLVYEAQAQSPSEEQMEALKGIVEGRVNRYGVGEATVQRLGDKRILVQLPGVKDVGEAKRLIGQTANLVFKERECEAVCGPTVPFTDKDTGLTGEDLVRAAPTTHPTSGDAQVQIQFNNRGTDIFADLTKRIWGDQARQLAIFLDDQEVISAVVISPILDGNSVITGNFTLDEAKRIAVQLEGGRLPVPLGDPIVETTVDATLGQDSLDASLVAGGVGFALVVLFMVLYYRLAGLLASIALAAYIVLTLAVFKLVPVTLTLTGVAAFVLSVGMAVDANVMIFERMKEELRAGRSLSSAIEVGFNRAWTSIRDSNVTTFITTGILYWFASETGITLVQGFALTLFIGVAVSMFSAITISRTLLLLIAATPLGRVGALFAPDTKPVTKAAPQPAGGR
jgi:preprotein translocase subunit SecD